MSVIGDLRKLFEDIVSPQLIALKQEVKGLDEDVKGLSNDLKETQKKVSELGERLSKLEGKYENAEQIILAKMQGAIQRGELIVPRPESETRKTISAQKQ